MEFKIGDVVQLKSGGPAMTINNIDGNDVSCVWFLNDKTRTGEVFDYRLLTYYKTKGIPWITK